MNVIKLPAPGLTAPQPLMFGRLGYDVILLTPVVEGDVLKPDNEKLVHIFELGFKVGYAAAQITEETR